MDWSKARTRDQQRADHHYRSDDDQLRQAALQAFALKHTLVCFKCGQDGIVWAKTGISGRGPWAICTACVQTRTDTTRPRSGPRTNSTNPRAQGTNKRATSG